MKIKILELVSPRVKSLERKSKRRCPLMMFRSIRRILASWKSSSKRMRKAKVHRCPRSPRSWRPKRRAGKEFGINTHTKLRTASSLAKSQRRAWWSRREMSTKGRKIWLSSWRGRSVNFGTESRTWGSYVSRMKLNGKSWLRNATTTRMMMKKKRTSHGTTSTMTTPTLSWLPLPSTYSRKTPKSSSATAEHPINTWWTITDFALPITNTIH